MATLSATTSQPDLTEPAGRDLTGILQVLIPVSDLARSAAWYRDLLDLEYVREFCDGKRVTGCGLVDWTSRYMVSLRLRSSTAGNADLRGEHPIILEAADAAAAQRVRDRAASLGISATAGRHFDGEWLEFVDPDGIALRVVHSAAGPRNFFGIEFAGEQWTRYSSPRLTLDKQP